MMMQTPWLPKLQRCEISWPYYDRVCNASKSQVYSYTEQPEFALNQAAFEVRPPKLFQILIPIFEGLDGAVRHEQ